MPHKFDFRGWGRKSGKTDGLSGYGELAPTDQEPASSRHQQLPESHDEWVPVLHTVEPDRQFISLTGNPKPVSTHNEVLVFQSEPETGNAVEPIHGFFPERFNEGDSRLNPSRLRIRASLALERQQALLFNAFAQEQSSGTPFLLFTILVGLGVVGYFLLPVEPIPHVLVVTFVMVTAFMLRQQRHGALRMVLAASVAILAGAAGAQLRSHLVLGPALQGQFTGQISGEVISVERRANGSVRYRIRVREIEGLKKHELPHLVRISARRGNVEISAGTGIAGLARLQAYSGPLYPGGYDFSFLPRYSGIGGTGFFMGAPRPTALSEDEQYLGTLATHLANVRTAIARRIDAALPGQTGAIANALITGERSGLSEETQESLRRSGLAHILAISGLHMALVTLTFIWFLRGIWSFFPGFSQNRPVRKYAAVGGIVVSTSYLMLSGNSIASQRAWIMIMVMLVAVLFDRKALTMRSVAVAALLIIMIAPESVFSAGFQMSFAAVAALVAVYGAWSRYKLSREGRFTSHSNGLATGLKSVLGYFSGLGATSIVAGAATALLAAYHFQRIAVLGLFANLLAMPLVSILVMPSALISMIAMPYGLEGLFLPIMGFGIEGVVAASELVNSYQSDRITGLLPPSFLFLGLSGLGILVAFSSRLRWFGLVPLASALFFVKPVAPPDIIIAENGRAIAVMMDTQTGLANSGEFPGPSTASERRLVYLYPGQSSFVRDNWAKAWPGTFVADHEDLETKPPALEQCDKERCIVNLGDKGAFHLVYDPDLLADSCSRATILAAPRLKWVRCRGTNQPEIILKREDFENRGTHALSYRMPEQDQGAGLFRRLWSEGQGETSVTTNIQPSHAKGTDPPEGHEPPDEGPRQIRSIPQGWTVTTALQNSGRPWQRKPVTYQDDGFVQGSR